MGRGSHCFRTDANSALCVTKWRDSKSVNLITSYIQPAKIETIKRWDRKEHKYFEIACLKVVKEYNNSMGGVDLSDMLIALYRTNIKTKRWYLKVLFHCVDIAKVNAWLLYRRHCEQSNIAKKKQLALLSSTTQIASALINAYSTQKPVTPGRPPKRKVVTTPPPQRSRPQAIPVDDARSDQTSHWPEYRTKKSRCRYCSVGQSRVYCQKYNLCLCMNGDRNCFVDFHSR